uniref:hypothetical protein n=1 Tax=Salmonella sp. s57610 TaxID=3159697 RepID=UPI003980F74C
LHPTFHQINHSQNLAKTLIPWQKPFISGIASSPSNFRVMRFPRREITNNCISRRVGSTIKAIGTTDTSTRVKALVTVKVTVGGFLSDIKVSSVVDNVTDLFGKSILLELVSAELDPEGLEKPTIKGYAHKQGQEGDEVKYECDFDIPDDFGEIGAVLVE